MSFPKDNKVNGGLARLLELRNVRHFTKQKEVSFSDAERINYFRMFDRTQVLAIS